jgi:arylsulfatase B
VSGGEDHYSQGSGSQDGEGPGTVDLWDGHGISNRTGIYSGYNYAQRAVEVIANYTATTMAARAAGNDAENGLFMYLAWHNTHTPLECPEEWMYPATYNNSDSARMTYNCMARILDDGIGNVTSALKAGGVWDKTLIIFAADNGGWVGNTGSNNYPLKGSKVSDFEGGVRAVSFVSGGYLPINVRGSHHSGLIAVADW